VLRSLQATPSLHRCGGARGAGVLLLLLVTGSVVAASAGVEAAWGAVDAEGRARIAADAAAHAAEVTLIHAPDADRLSDALQSGQATCVYPAPPGASGTDPAAAGSSLDHLACQAAWQSAVDAATANGGRIVDLIVSPDPRDMNPGAGAGTLEVTVHVQVSRRLPVVSRFCSSGGSAICWVEAWAGAQEHRRS
jgi:hypothetical protein